MKIWENLGSPEEGEYIVRMSTRERKRIQDAYSTYEQTQQEEHRTKKPEIAEEISSNIAKFIGSSVFSYSDEKNKEFFEVVADAEAVSDVWVILKNYGANKTSQLLANTVINEAFCAMEQKALRTTGSSPVKDVEELQEIILTVK